MEFTHLRFCTLTTACADDQTEAKYIAPAAFCSMTAWLHNAGSNIKYNNGDERYELM